MSHGENANKNWGREYWSRRHRGMLSWGKVAKQLTHEKERMIDKKIVQDELKNFNKDDKSIKED